MILTDGLQGIPFLVLLIQCCHAVTWDSACGVTKGCFPNCQSAGCSYLVTWSDTGSAVDFTISADESDSNKWIALSFTSDYRMGDDSVVSCIPVTNTIQSYYNDDTDTDLLSNPTLGLSATSVSHSNGILSCSFTRTRSESSDSKYFDITNDWIIQLGIGEVEAKHGGYKMNKHHMIPYGSVSVVDFQSNSIVDVKKLNGSLVKLHGCMMMLAWIIFSSIGIITARYNKGLFSEKKLFGTKPWFQIHRAAMVITVVCVVVGFIPIFVEVEGYSQITPPSNEGFVSAHPILGIIVTSLVILNPIMAMLRPGPDHKFRPLFNWGHLGVGMITQLLAVITIFFGYVLERSGLPNNAAIYITIVYVVIVVIVVVVMEIFKFKEAKNEKVKTEHTLSNGVTSSSAELTMKEEELNKEPSNFPMFVFFLFILAVFSLAMGILGVIAGS